MKIKSPFTPIKVAVDLRPSFTKIRDQGRRPLCLVFAASDIHSYQQAVDQHFSVEYLAYHSYKVSGRTDYQEGVSVPSVCSALADYGQPFETDLPYDEEITKPKTPVNKNHHLFYSRGIQKKGITQAVNIIEALDKGKAVLLGLELSRSFFVIESPYVLDWEKGDYGRHAVIALGHGELPSGEVAILIRNSWGESWGDRGYAWLTLDFIENRVFTTVVLEK